MENFNQFSKQIWVTINLILFQKQLMDNPNFIVELFIKTLEIKHKLVFEKDKEEYFRVLFDTYLNGQGNISELKEYIAAGIENPETINLISEEVIQWQGKAEELRNAQLAKKNEKEAEKEKIEQFVASRTKKLREEAEQERKQRKERKDRGQEVPKKKQKKEKPEQEQPKPVEKKEEVQEVDQSGQNQLENNLNNSKSLKYELQAQGKQKCKFYPYCKNLESCPYFHPSQRCTFFPHCRYGDGCLYEHEACRFKEKCNRTNCPYSHPFKKKNPIEEMMKSFMSQNHPLSMGKPYKKKPYNKQKGDNKEEEHQQPQADPKN